MESLDELEANTRVAAGDDEEFANLYRDVVLGERGRAGKGLGLFGIERSDR